MPLESNTSNLMLRRGFASFMTNNHFSIANFSSFLFLLLYLLLSSVFLFFPFHSGERRTRAGAATARSWPSTACTVRWCGTRCRCQSPFYEVATNVHPGCWVRIERFFENSFRSSKYTSYSETHQRKIRLMFGITKYYVGLYRTLV